jgi:predicted RNase H-like nuclease
MGSVRKVTDTNNSRVLWPKAWVACSPSRLGNLHSWLMSLVVGVDGFSKGWTAVVLIDGVFDDAVEIPRLDALVDRYHDAGAIAVDIPIGLPQSGYRRVDLEARAFVGLRRNSVFMTAPLGVMQAATYEEAAVRSRELSGVGLTRQLYGLREKILEAHSIGRLPHVIEVHPEVSFRALAGHPLGASKASWNGLMHRRKLLAEVGIHIPEYLPSILRSHPDDVLDAAAAAWTANRFALGTALKLPQNPEADEKGQPIAIWY